MTSEWRAFTKTLHLWVPTSLGTADKVVETTKMFNMPILYVSLSPLSQAPSPTHTLSGNPAATLAGNSDTGKSHSEHRSKHLWFCSLSELQTATSFSLR